jgi:GNAT superfamily N-acetyltransferase
MLEVRAATSDEDLAHIARIVGAVTPDNTTSVSEMRWQEEHYPGGRRFIAWLDGEAVAGGGVGRVYVYPPEFPGLWGNITVLPEHRRKGVGSAMYVAISEVARAAGKTLLVGRTTSDRPEAIAWMEHRGFEEHERMKVVRLALVGVPLPALEVPEGVELTSLETRPDLVEGVYQVAQEALPDIPGDGPVAPDTIEEFVMRDVDRAAVPQGGFAVAIEKDSGRVVGYANLLSPPGTSKIAWHGMTAVAREWRGRGLARALKVSTIHWAAANGLEGLDTANDIENAPMRAVNRRLGYEPQPDEIYYRGPLAPARESSRA